MTSPIFRRLVFGCVLAALTSLPVATGASELVSYARVQPDATLLVGSRTVRLYGIYIPPTGRTCRSNLRPVKCGSRAVLALDFKIRGFVRCERLHKHAYLIERGWAVAMPGGPFEYQVLERIARNRGMGVWGMHGTAVASSSATR
jgi:endonuclease YncB( thermonuclease family)